METTQTTTETGPASSNGRDQYAYRSRRWFLLKLVLALIILLVTFIAGVCWGAAFSRLRQLRGAELGTGFRTSGMMAPFLAGDSRYVHMGSARGLFGRADIQENGEQQKTGGSFFGSIVRVEGSKITILNNGSQEQQLLSQVDTAIFLQDRLVSVTQLAPGQVVGGIGSLNADGSMNIKQLLILP